MQDVKSIVYKTIIAHYGGQYVYVPLEKLPEFKACFPKGTFPRKVEIKDVVDEWTPQGAAQYMARFPYSRKVAIIHFADGTMGLQHLEDNLELPPCI